MWIVFIEVNPFFDSAFNAAKALGLNVLYLSQQLDLVNSVKNKSEFQIKIDSFDKKYLLSTLKSLDFFNSIIGVLALKDSLIPITGFLNTKLKIKNRYYSNELIWKTKDKFQLRQSLNSLPYNPNYQLVQMTDATNFKSYPNGTILKPILGFNSIGVEKVATGDNFHEAYARAFSVVDKINTAVNVNELAETTNSSYVHTSLLVEECVVGKEVSVEVFAENGNLTVLGICGKTEMIAPFFEEISYQMPCQLNKSFAERLNTAAVEIMTKLGMKNGIAHMEFIINDKRTYILDIGLRIGGSGLTHDLVFLSTGINLVEIVIANMIGREVSLDLKNRQQDISLLFLQQVGTGGKILNNNANCKIINELEFVRAQFFNKIGDTIYGYPNYSGLPGYALFQVKEQSDNSFERASDLLDACIKGFEIIYEK